MTNDTVDYAYLVDNAMRTVVRDVLRQVQRVGLPGQHHFFISFRTDHPNTQISETLRSKYPHEITIVLQHQFWDLFVAEDHFKVSLSFNNVPEKLVVPFAALTGFADPSTKFGLQFHHEQNEPIEEPTMPISAATSLAAAAAADAEAPKEGAEIIALDAFRKNKK